MLQYLKAYTPFWKKVNGILGIMLALVILVSTLSVFGMLFVLDGAENENAMLPTRTEYEEPYIRIGLSYGSSKKYMHRMHHGYA